MNSKVEFFMLNHEDTHFYPKSSHFLQFVMKNENPSENGFVNLMESLMKKSYEFDKMFLELKQKI